MIRAGQTGDQAAMGRILSDWIDATPWMPRLHSREEDMAFCQGLLEATEVWVLILHDRAEGFLSLRGQEIAALYLAPEARGQGHGKALLEAAKRTAERLSLWTFQANAAAVRFYLREGFEVALRTDGAGNDEKLPDLRLEWSAP